MLLLFQTNICLQGKSFEIDLSENDESKNLEKIKKMCEDLLVNSVIEDYKIKKI